MSFDRTQSNTEKLSVSNQLSNNDKNKKYKIIKEALSWRSIVCIVRFGPDQKNGLTVGEKKHICINVKYVVQMCFFHPPSSLSIFKPNIRVYRAYNCLH